ncbi:hypothetical protein MHB40_03165 [Lysinibacillus sp. FSL K6-0057]|uniref:hypothetical protein n=1 Tax=Lysinibacillus sp. FSL K6-0057 TaxID=2921411 RepID=UPI00315B3B88
MSIFDKRYVTVTINQETYFREVGMDDELGVRMAEDEFNNMILDAVYNEIIEEEFMVNFQQVNTIIQTIPNVLDRQILQNFYNYAVRVDGVE